MNDDVKLTKHLLENFHIFQLPCARSVMILERDVTFNDEKDCVRWAPLDEV